MEGSERAERSRVSSAVARACLSRYRLLPAGAKPGPREWTVLAGLVQSERGEMRAVALGTGSKCLGRSALDAEGRALNDSHAEVVARRSFLRYLYEQIEAAIAGAESICERRDDGLFSIRASVGFHLYVSRPPCGDAAIVHDEDSGALRLRTNTGAKLLGARTDVDDRREPLLSEVRRKPGRGDPTLSVSCSDKIARWISMGIQGALLSALLASPPRIDTIVVGGDDAREASLRRALLDRARPTAPPRILVTRERFEHDERGERSRPCFSSASWCAAPVAPLEVAVAGRRRGSTAKNRHSDSAALRISKRKLFERFLAVVKETEGDVRRPRFADDDTYGAAKRKCDDYKSKWNRIKKEVFCMWTEKPDIFNFKVVRPSTISASECE